MAVSEEVQKALDARRKPDLNEMDKQPREHQDSAITSFGILRRGVREF